VEVRMQNINQNSSTLVFMKYRLAMGKFKHVDNPGLCDISTVFRKAVQIFSNIDTELKEIQRSLN
jgi:hypothetical protein